MLRMHEDDPRIFLGDREVTLRVTPDVLHIHRGARDLLSLHRPTAQTPLIPNPSQWVILHEPTVASLTVPEAVGMYGLATRHAWTLSCERDDVVAFVVCDSYHVAVRDSNHLIIERKQRGYPHNYIVLRLAERPVESIGDNVYYYGRRISGSGILNGAIRVLSNLQNTK